ncbi:IS1634 family transposase [Streptosporangium sp. CA-115845]|uniref:IS1634 family transposase n=1 Tax=Streptosporangium sp. CA-115845 TaxID=3240071 RepID=UPI003D939576
MEKTLGALPVVADFCRKLRIADVVDALCPVGDLAELTHGQVIEVLVANRLTSPAPLVHVADRAQAWAVGEAFGIEADLLNDDRIGRALDAIAPHLDHLTGSVGPTAIEAFGVEASRMHWDMTSISLHGAYEQAEQGYAAPRFGHPKDRRPDLKQIQAGIAVTGDGAISVFHRAFDGGAGEVGQVIGAMKALQRLASAQRLLMIGDSKLISYPNLAAMCADGVAFIAPASKTYVPATELAGLDLSAATRIDHVARRDAAKAAPERGSWHVVEDTMALAGPRKKDPVLALRRVFVHSSARARAAAAARAKKLDRARDDLERLQRGLGSRHYPDLDKVTARIAVISRERQVRRALALHGSTKVDGLYAGRPAVPTGRLIFEALAGLRIIPGTGQSPPVIPQPTPVQAHLLDLLDVDPRDLR